MANGLVLMRFRAHRGSAVAEAAGRLELPDVCRTRVYETALGTAETALVIDAPALALVPAWSAGSLAAALGSETAALLGLWQCVRYGRSQRVWRWADVRSSAPV